MNDIKDIQEYRITVRKSNFILGLVAIAIIVGGPAILGRRELGDALVNRKLWTSGAILLFALLAAFLGFVVWICVKGLINPPLMLLANSSGITLGGGRLRHFYPWREVKGFGVGEMIIALPNQSPSKEPALRIEFEDTADLTGGFSTGYWGNPSPDDAGVFLIWAKELPEKLEVVVQRLSQIKRNAM